MNESTACRWCDEVHAERYLCDPANKVLLALYAQGVSGDMPTIEWPAPIPMAELVARMGLVPGDQLLTQVTVMGAVVPVAGVPWPAVVLSGRTADGEALPRWLYAADAAGLRQAVALFKRMSELAIGKAKEQRRAAS